MSQTFRSLVLLTALVVGLATAQVQPGDAETPRVSPQEAAAKQSSDKDGWKPLFDGKSLEGWKRTEFVGGGAVRVDKEFKPGSPAILIDAGDRLSGFQWTKETPKTNYEISLEAMKIKGSDFLCGLTFPVGESHATLILGGWGGGVVGISSIDSSDASENETTKYVDFALDKWYKVRVRVTPQKLEAWLEDKQIVDLELMGRKITLRPGEISMQVPLGISTFRTSAAYRSIRIRAVPK